MLMIFAYDADIDVQYNTMIKHKCNIIDLKINDHEKSIF